MTGARETLRTAYLGNGQSNTEILNPPQRESDYQYQQQQRQQRQILNLPGG